MRRYVTLSIALLACLLTNASLSAAVQLPNIFSDNMVLLAGVDQPVWGTANPGEKITVSLAGQTVSVTADKDGNWRVMLKPMKADGKTLEMTVQDSVKTHAIKNVLIGEVWLCSGQSNMHMSLRGTENGTKVASTSDYPQVRLFFGQGWVVCTPQNSQAVGELSGVAYYFARSLNEELKVPVGIFINAVCGVPIAPWMPRESLDSDPAFKPLVATWDKMIRKLDIPAIEAHKKQMDEWRKQVAEAKAKNQSLPPRPPKGPKDIRDSDSRPARLFERMAANLTGVPLRGVAWYQGESDLNHPELYAKLLPAMIKGWRKWAGRADLPFLIVQMPSIGKQNQQAPVEKSAWVQLRESQDKALALPNTAMVVTFDFGRGVHPLNKLDVGRRLCLAALAMAYGWDKVTYRGPVYDTMKVEGDKVRLTFSHTTGGLRAFAKPPIPTPLPGKDGKITLPKVAEVSVKGFAIAGEDRMFYWAEAQIDGDSVILSSSKVKNPVAIRYCWAGVPIGNLYNGVGLPAGPFRTDDWADDAPKKPDK